MIQSTTSKIPFWLLSESTLARMGLFPLDTAANIYPATVTRSQSHLFRLSVELMKPVEADILQQATNRIAPRFPTIAARLCTGFFWYKFYPAGTISVRTGIVPLCARMTKREMKQNCIRVIADGRQMMVEYFHGLCDGYAAMCFLKSLAAEYIHIAEKICVPERDGVYRSNTMPMKSELTDAFQTYAISVSKKRDGGKALSLTGNSLAGGQQINHEITISVDEILKKAHEAGVTITAYLASCLLFALQKIWQEEKHPPRGKLRVSFPVNLRQFFPTDTLRNFSHFVIVEIDPQKGRWTFDEICQSVHHQMKQKATRKEMQAEISNNVRILQNSFFRWIPLCIKNLMMRVSYWIFGTNTSCLTISNLGRITVPDEMKAYVRRFHVQLDAHKGSPYSCAVHSYGGELTISMTRSIEDDRLERYFFQIVQKAEY